MGLPIGLLASREGPRQSKHDKPGRRPTQRARHGASTVCDPRRPIDWDLEGNSSRVVSHGSSPCSGGSLDVSRDQHQCGVASHSCARIRTSAPWCHRQRHGASLIRGAPRQQPRTTLVGMEQTAEKLAALERFRPGSRGNSLRVNLQQTLAATGTRTSGGS
jgi:hypothetical protein